jgi:3-methylcrotonyl-CoA carboxylase alpha subunit
MRSILVANRSEIARRVFRTARAMGLHTVAVYSEPDADAPFVHEADVAVPLRGSTSTETYLDVNQILEAARISGADAIHPGYGFLSENPDFAEAVEAAGLTWIGPSPHSIRAMALKVEAKRLAAEADLPLIPGAELPEDITDEQAQAIADGIGYPLLVKASAGGGGKGMRTVTVRDEVVEAIAAARREAASAFGDATVFCERYLERSRHVEVQVFGDTHGRVVHLFERECSIQRRHQKIVEESPSPALMPLTAERMYVAAAALARAIGYVGAGTVEFLVADTDAGQEFFFLEMNTRLQVEHPVTEAITGLDLVEWQIRVARGEMLPRSQSEITRSGHAIEVRLYAEDPARGYLPNTGTLVEFDIPPVVRLDSGVESHSVVSAFYDPMLAKVIAHAPDRVTAANILSSALRRSRIAGLVTNRSSLAAILESEAFQGGETTTDFLERYPSVLTAQLPTASLDRHLIAAVVASTPRADVPIGWRNVPGTPETHRFASAADDTSVDNVQVTWFTGQGRGETLTAVVGDRRYGATVLRGADAPESHHAFDLVVDGVRMSFRVDHHGSWVVVDDGRDTSQWRVLPRLESAGGGEGAAQGPSTPVPGTVTVVEVSPGDHVVAGQTLVIIEAMKMEHRITADSAAVVAEVLVEVGQSVDAHAVVVVLEGLGTTADGGDPQ